MEINYSILLRNILKMMKITIKSIKRFYCTSILIVIVLSIIDVVTKLFYLKWPILLWYVILGFLLLFISLDFYFNARKIYPKPIKFFTPSIDISLFGKESDNPILKEKYQKLIFAWRCLLAFLLIIVTYYVLVIVFSKPNFS